MSSILAILALLNYKAIVIAAIVYFAFSSLWYARPVLGGIWMRETNVTPDPKRKTARWMIISLGGTLILYFIAAVVLNLFLGPSSTPAFGAFIGGLVSLGWIAAIQATNFIFEARSWKLFLITAGNSFIGFMLMGLIIGWIR